MQIGKNLRDAWVTRLVEGPTLNFSSGHNIRVVRSSPMWGSALGCSLLRIFPLLPPTPFSFSHESIHPSLEFKLRKILICSTGFIG